MDVVFTKHNEGVRLSCFRPDSSVVSANLGPSFPFHDLAHFVVEQAYSLSEGFFGNIRRGYSFDALSQPDTIRTLGTQALQAEVLARNLQALYSGACTPADFSWLVETELNAHGLAVLEPTDPETALRLLGTYQRLVAAWEALPAGESLRLAFE